MCASDDPHNDRSRQGPASNRQAHIQLPTPVYRSVSSSHTGKENSCSSTSPNYPPSRPSYRLSNSNLQSIKPAAQDHSPTSPSISLSSSFYRSSHWPQSDTETSRQAAEAPAKSLLARAYQYWSKRGKPSADDPFDQASLLERNEQLPHTRSACCPLHGVETHGPPPSHAGSSGCRSRSVIDSLDRPAPENTTRMRRSSKEHRFSG